MANISLLTELGFVSRLDYKHFAPLGLAFKCALTLKWFIHGSKQTRLRVSKRGQ